jgi:hypothetical protein
MKAEVQIPKLAEDLEAWNLNPCLTQSCAIAVPRFIGASRRPAI